ncbi:hypothetical protein [Vibrio comitans]|uniref:Uncharacterized protein n=1 Tax=Vibrio comitans NBRC 102076 TaxID=1219078 RepID=A0A4Y3IMX8_9VIBR|nr:hypothetical protein [Vibrio comitans]GEA60756.1 hypothetical protein VCO01S_19490 [Vibrio comitans NBRC 102076]
MKYVILLALLTFNATAVEVPHTFKDGQRTSAEQMNQSFQALEESVNRLEVAADESGYDHIYGNYETNEFQGDFIAHISEYPSDITTTYYTVKEVKIPNCGTYRMPVRHDRVEFKDDYMLRSGES